jgi:clan AA aspartic protease (TIGR02281 family)
LFILFSINSFGQNYNFDQGIEFFKNQDYSKAIDCFTKAIDNEPKKGVYYFFRATCYNNLDEKNWALRDINTAINCFSKKEKSTFPGAYSFRGDLYREFEEYSKALIDYSESIKLDSKDPDYYYKRASLYFNLEQYSKAEADYKTILSIDESSVMAYGGLSWVSLEMDNNSDAEYYANKAIKMDPTYASGYLYRGNFYYKQKKYEQSFDDYLNFYILSDYSKYGEDLLSGAAVKNSAYALTKITSRIPTLKNPNDLIQFRAQIYESICKYSDAINDYNSLIETSEVDEKTLLYFLIAKCHMWMDNQKSMIDVLDKGLEYDSVSAVLYAYKGIAYNGLKNYKMANEYYDLAIKKDGEINWLYVYRAQNKIDEGNYQAALVDLDYAIAIDKNMILGYYTRALLYNKYLNNLEKAKMDFQFIAENDTNLYSGISKRQFAYYYLNNKTKAIEWQNELLNGTQTTSELYDAAKLYALMNEKDKSTDYLKQAIEKGYRNLSDILSDFELNSISSSAEFKKVVDDLKLLKQKDELALINTNYFESVDTISKVTIPMKSKGSGTYDVQCTVNKLKLNMIFDTGASVISISQTEVDFMLKNGYLTENDIVGSSSYMDANGDIEIGTTIILREVDFGGLILKNVRATVVHNKNAPLLFGQSALSKYGKITIDNAKKTITISK